MEWVPCIPASMRLRSQTVPGVEGAAEGLRRIGRRRPRIGADRRFDCLGQSFRTFELRVIRTKMFEQLPKADGLKALIRWHGVVVVRHAEEGFSSRFTRCDHLRRKVI